MLLVPCVVTVMTGPVLVALVSFVHRVVPCVFHFAQKRRGKRRKQKPPRRSERLMAKSSDRPHYASRLLERHNTAVAFQNPSDAFGLNQLATLAVAAAAMWDEPVRVKPQIGPRDGRRVPLPSDPQDVLEAQADDIVWKAPLPKAMRRAAERKGQVQPPPDGKEYADEPIAGAEVQPAQYAAIHLLLHQHAQALVQTLAMAVATGDADTAAGAKAMLVELCEFAGQQTRNREGMGYPPYVDECLGVHVMDQPQLKGDPWRPLTARRGSMYTVANALVLSQVGDMLALMPPSLPADQVLPPMVPASGDGEDEAGASGPPGKKKKRKKPNHHPIWAKLPVSVARAIAPVRAFFDPDAEPGVPDGFNPTSQLLFTPAEDVLLAWGIRK